MKRPTVFLASVLWSSLNQLTRQIKRPSVRLPSKVISVGNIEAGGTGKTPLVAEVARFGVARGKMVAILLRGYGGTWEKSGGLLAPKDFVRPEESGDEAALLHELVPNAWIGVGADREASYNRISQRLGKNPDWVVLDDGFQQFHLMKDLEIVTVTSRTSWEAPFREFATALSGADLVVWTKGNIRPSRAEVRTQMVLERVPSSAVSLYLVTGVADGKSVARSVEVAGYRVFKLIERADHSPYTRGEIDGWVKEAEAAHAELATTGKDAVKWKALGVSDSCYRRLEPKVEIIEGLELWNRKLSEL